MSKKVRVTGIAVPEQLYKMLENKRGRINRSRFYVDLIRLGLQQEGVQ